MIVREGGRRFRPGQWLLGDGWWVLPALLALGLGLPYIFGERWYSDTPYYQAIATQMVRDGGSTWWSPMQGDLPYFNKPPLAFWIHAAAAWVFGGAGWAVYLPELVAFIAVCLLVSSIARRLHGPIVGLLAGCVMALTNEWIWRVSNFKLDSLHTMFLLGTLACWIKAFDLKGPEQNAAAENRWPAAAWMILAGCCIGAALMTKPFYGMGIGVLAIIWLALSRELRARRAAMIGMSVGVGVLLAAPWHVAMVARNGQAFIRAYLHEQTVERAIGNFHDHEPWNWYFKLIAGMVPESLQPERMWPIYGLALVGLVVVAMRWRSGSTRTGDALAALWAVAWIVALSLFGGKRNYYLMVVHPGTAWLAGIAIGRVIEWCGAVGSRRSVESLVRATAVMGVVAGGVALACVPSLAARARRELTVPDRDALMGFLRSQQQEHREIFATGLSYRVCSIAYLQTGCWPRCISERKCFLPHQVPAGGLMVYSNDMLDKRAFGTYVDPRDELVFRSAPTGQFQVYRRHAAIKDGAMPLPHAGRE